MVITTRARVYVAVNQAGHRIGETHHNARISDAIVEQMRDRREFDEVSYLNISREFGLSLGTVRKILAYQRRGQVVARWKVIHP